MRHVARLRFTAIACAAALVLVALPLTSCAPRAGTDRGTAAEAKAAFEKLYPGVPVTKVTPNADSWLVDATVAPTAQQLYGPYDPNGTPPRVGVRIPVMRSNFYHDSTTIDGVTWSADGQLDALVQRNPPGEEGETLLDVVTYDTEVPGTVISRVRAGGGSAVVSFIGPEGQPWDEEYEWGNESGESSTTPSEWLSGAVYPLETWQQQASLLRRVVQAFVLSTDRITPFQESPSETVVKEQVAEFGKEIAGFALTYQDSPPEPKGTALPHDGRFVARIVAVDRSRRTITIDRVSTFLGDSAYRAARADGADAPSDDFYVRNRVKERTVLPLGGSVAFTTFDPIQPWQPKSGQDGLASITALSESEFMTEYPATAMKRVGAWIRVSGGRVVAVIGNYEV